jgi:hypothetical protein
MVSSFPPFLFWEGARDQVHFSSLFLGKGRQAIHSGSFSPILRIATLSCPGSLVVSNEEKGFSQYSVYWNEMKGEDWIG